MKMPLLSPQQIKSVLKEAVKTDNDLQAALNENSLSPTDLIEQLGSTIRQADSTAMRLKGLEIGFKLNKMLGSNDEGPQVPIVNIIINDSEFSVNPILIPR